MSCVIRRGHLHFKRIARRKDVKQIASSVNENLIKGTFISFGPSEMNDIVIHHAKINLNEVLQNATDVGATCLIASLFSILYIILKNMYD